MNWSKISLSLHRIAIGGLSGLLLLFCLIVVVDGLSNPWLGVRLAPAISLVEEGAIYPGAENQTWISTLYPPLGHLLYSPAALADSAQGAAIMGVLINMLVVGVTLFLGLRPLVSNSKIRPPYFILILAGAFSHAIPPLVTH